MPAVNASLCAMPQRCMRLRCSGALAASFCASHSLNFHALHSEPPCPPAHPGSAEATPMNLSLLSLKRFNLLATTFCSSLFSLAHPSEAILAALIDVSIYLEGGQTTPPQPCLKAERLSQS